MKISHQEKTETVSMATPNLKSEIKGYCILSVTLQAQTYNDTKFTILDGLCTDIILGQTFMKKHRAIMLSFGRDLPPLNICSLAVSNVTPPTLFSYLSKDCHFITTKRHKYSHDDKNFKDREIKCLLAEKFFEPSNSLWRAQVVITANENGKKRLCIDYSQTINCFTHLDAYPLPRIDDQVHAFFISNTFISNARLKLAKNQANAKQHLEPEFLLFENYSHCSSTLSSRNNKTYSKK